MTDGVKRRGVNAEKERVLFILCTQIELGRNGHEENEKEQREREWKKSSIIQSVLEVLDTSVHHEAS